MFDRFDLDSNNQVTPLELRLVREALEKHNVTISLSEEILSPLNTGKVEKELFISNPPPNAPNKPSPRGR